MARIRDPAAPTSTLERQGNSCIPPGSLHGRGNPRRKGGNRLDHRRPQPVNPEKVPRRPHVRTTGLFSRAFASVCSFSGGAQSHWSYPSHPSHSRNARRPVGSMGQMGSRGRMGPAARTPSPGFLRIDRPEMPSSAPIIIIFLGERPRFGGPLCSRLLASVVCSSPNRNRYRNRDRRPSGQDPAVASITKPDRFGDPIPISIWTGARLTAPGHWFCANRVAGEVTLPWLSHHRPYGSVARRFPS